MVQDSARVGNLPAILPCYRTGKSLGVLGGTGTYSVPLRAFRALTPSRVWGFQAPEIVGGQGRRGPHV